jgi:hypothetical protein
MASSLLTKSLLGFFNVALSRGNLFISTCNFLVSLLNALLYICWHDSSERL